MRAAVCARFSSENQREQSIADQIRVCGEFAKRDALTVLDAHIYFDEAQSGSLRARPGLEALKRAAEDKQFDAVLVDESAFRGIINELYLTDLKKKTHRGQMGQVLRGFSVGSRGYGYASVTLTHLLSGALKCGACGGAIALVSGKGSGYYGCLNASRHACENKVLIGRKRLEDKFLATPKAEVLKPEVLDAVYERVARKLKEQFAHVPEELRLNVASMESAKGQAFTPPPRAWLVDRIQKLNDLLAQRTEQSALASGASSTA